MHGAPTLKRTVTISMEGFHQEFCEILANSCAAGKWLSTWLWIMLSQHMMINTPVQARQAAIRIIRETNHHHPPAQQSSGY